MNMFKNIFLIALKIIYNFLYLTIFLFKFISLLIIFSIRVCLNYVFFLFIFLTQLIKINWIIFIKLISTCTFYFKNKKFNWIGKFYKQISIFKNCLFKLIFFFFIKIHLQLHIKSNLYRTILFFWQYNYFSLLWTKLCIKYANFTKLFILKPINFTFFWHSIVLLLTFCSFIVFSGWFFFFYILCIVLISLYCFYLFLTILFQYILFYWKNKFLFIYLFFIKIKLDYFIKTTLFLEQKFTWKKIYLFRKKQINKNPQFFFNQCLYQLSSLLLTLQINNSVKQNNLQLTYDIYSKKYLDSVDSSIFFKQKKLPLSNTNTQDLQKIYFEHQHYWAEFGIVGYNLYSKDQTWQTSLISQITNNTDFYFFTKLQNYFAKKANKTWDKFKVLTIMDTYDDFSYYNNANMRLDHFYGDMSAAAEEIGYLKHQRLLNNDQKFINFFKQKIKYKNTNLFNLEDEKNIISLHKQNKVSIFTWKTLYFLLRKHREFQWSAKRLQKVYKKESFESNKKANFWNKSKINKTNNFKKISWPLFFSNVLPSIFYSFSFLHDIIFTLFIEYVNDFFKSQFQFLKLNYKIKQALISTQYNKSLYFIFYIFFIQFIWFIFYDFWKYTYLLSKKIKWNFKYFTLKSNFFIFILNYSLRWLISLIQYLKINDYFLISYLSCYKWNKFFSFKIQSYYKVNKTKGFYYYYRYGYILLIIDFFFFIIIYFFLFVYDLIKMILSYFFYKKLKIQWQQNMILLFQISNLIFLFFIYIPYYKINSWFIYFNLWYDFLYTTKYNYLSVEKKRYHMSRYNIYTDLEGNWIEKDVFSKFFLKNLIFFKIINQYWWSIYIVHKKGLERWPFFYNWFKLLPEINIIYKSVKISIFLFLFYSKKFLFIIYDFFRSTYILMYKTTKQLSFRFLFKYIFYFIKIFFNEVFFFFFFFFFSPLYKKQKIKNYSLDFFSFCNSNYNKYALLNQSKYKSTCLVNKLVLSKTKKTQQPSFSSSFSATGAFENLYNSFNVNCTAKSNIFLEHQQIKTLYLLNTTHFLNTYTNKFLKNKSYTTFQQKNYNLNRNLYLQNQSVSLNKLKKTTNFLLIDKLWFAYFCKITQNILKTIIQLLLLTNNKPHYNIKLNLFFKDMIEYKNKLTLFYNNKKNFKSFFLLTSLKTIIQKKKSTLLHTNFNFKSTNTFNFLTIHNLNFNVYDFNFLFISKQNNRFIYKILILFYIIRYLIFIENIFILKFITFIHKKLTSNSKTQLKSIKIKKTKNNRFLFVSKYKFIIYYFLKNPKVCFYLFKLYKNKPKNWNFLNKNNKYHQISKTLTFLELLKLLHLFKIYYQIKNLTYNKYCQNVQIKNKLYWRYTLLKDIFNPLTKTKIIDEFLGLEFKNQITINTLIYEELKTLENQKYLNFNVILQEWNILNFNYFFYLKNEFKKQFLNYFSTSRITLNYKILRILYNNWRLQKRSQKFTRYFLTLFKTLSQAFNFNRKNAFASWHVFFGTNYSGESNKSFHRIKIKTNENNNFWQKIKKKFKTIRKNDKQNYFLWFNFQLNKHLNQSPSKNTIYSIKDSFVVSEDNFKKRVFLGFFSNDYLKQLPRLYRYKIKFFLWRNYSKTRFFFYPSMVFFWFSLFGVTLLFNFDVFTNSIIWSFQLIFVFFEQWLSLLCLIPLQLLLNYFLIDFNVLLNSLIEPLIVQIYFLNPEFFFFKIDTIKFFIDWYFLILNNSYIIEDYSIIKTVYQFILACFLIGLYGIWAVYLQITWITCLLGNAVCSIFNFSYIFSLFFWEFLLNWCINLILGGIYSIYLGLKIDWTFVIFLYMSLMKFFFYFIGNFLFLLSYSMDEMFIYESYFKFIIILFNNYISPTLLNVQFLITLIFSVITFYFNMIFYYILYYFLFYKAYILYYWLILKYIASQIKLYFYFNSVLYLNYIFQDFVFIDTLEYFFSLWIWVYFNCIYFIIICPLKFFIYSFWVILKKFSIFFILLPNKISFIILKSLSLIKISGSFLFSQLILLYNLCYFLITTFFYFIYTNINIDYLLVTNIFSYIQLPLEYISWLLLFPYIFFYNIFCFCGLDFFFFSLYFQLTAGFSFFLEILYFLTYFFWNYISGLWGYFFLLNDFILFFFPNLDKILYPFGGFSIFYAIIYYYFFIIFAILWSRSFRIFNDTSKEPAVPEFIWDKVRFEIEGAKIYSLLPFSLYKLLWIEKLSSNKNITMSQELLDSLDTWTKREKRASYQLLVRLHDTPLNIQGFYYKYFTDLVRPFVIKYYKQKLSVKTKIHYFFPWTLYKMLFKRLRYSMWLWYVEGYLAYVTEEEPDAIYSAGPSAGDIAGREANFDGQFDVLLKDEEIIQKVKRLKLYNFYFIKKTNNNVGIAQDVWLTFPIIGHVFGRHHLKRIKAMKNREAFIFEFTPGIDQHKSLNASELTLNKYYLKNWQTLNKSSIWELSINRAYGNSPLYSEPEDKLLDLKANPKFYKLNRYVKVDEDDGINPDFFNDFMYIGSRSFDLLLTPFLTFAAVNTAWWNQDNGILNASYRFLELSNLADLLVSDYIKNEFNIITPYQTLRQQFLSSFSTGTARYEFLELEENDINLIKYGYPLITKNVEEIQTQLSSEIAIRFPEINDDKNLFPKKINDLILDKNTKNILDDILIDIFEEYISQPIIYDRWDSSLKDLLLSNYTLPQEDIKKINPHNILNLWQNIYNLKDTQVSFNNFITNLEHLIIDEMLYSTPQAKWESAFTNKIVNKSLGLTTKNHSFGQTLKLKHPVLFDKDLEVGAEITDTEKSRRIKGAAQEKLLEATTANYNIYNQSLASYQMSIGAHTNFFDSISSYLIHNSSISDRELNNLVFINFFNSSLENLLLNKKEVKQMSDLNLINFNKSNNPEFTVRTEKGIRAASIKNNLLPTRFEIEERDKVLEYLRPEINDTISIIEDKFLNHPDPSMVNLFEECAEELLLGKLVFKTTSASPAFGFFVKYYILQRLFSLYITAYEGTFFGDLLYYFTRSLLVRSPVTGIDVLPLIALDINNNADIYYLSGFYGLPRITNLQKEFLMPYTQYTYTQHYLLKSLQQQSLLYFTEQEKFLKQAFHKNLTINWNIFPYLHPELDVDKRVRMIYQHIYSASFNFPNIYNEGLYLVKLREFFYTLGLEVWLSELKDMFTVNNRFILGGWAFLNNITSFDFWISFFRADWIVFIENHANWFEFTFHVFGYLEREIDLYPVIWYSMHIIEYTKTALWLFFDVTKFLYFPNMSLYYIRFNFWFEIIKPFFTNFKFSLINANKWWYQNFWVYRWFVDVNVFFLSSFINKSILNNDFGFFWWNIRFFYLMHIFAYWKQLINLVPSLIIPTFFLNSVNMLPLDLYAIFSRYFIDQTLINIIPLEKQTMFMFFLTHQTSFLFYNLWYDYYLRINDITTEQQNLFLSETFRSTLNKRYDTKLYPTLLKENIISPYSFKINYGNYFLTTSEVNLLYNTDFYKQDTIAIYNAFDFLLTNPLNAIFYKNFVDIGDTKNNEIGFLFNFQALYQDIMTMYISTNILKTINVETFQAFKIYEDQLKISNLRFFYYYYFQLIHDYEIVNLSENTDFTELLVNDCFNKNLLTQEDKQNWSILFNKHSFILVNNKSTDNIYYLVRQNLDGSYYIFKQTYNDK